MIPGGVLEVAWWLVIGTIRSDPIDLLDKD
jgi:hypothetical protein